LAQPQLHENIPFTNEFLLLVINSINLYIGEKVSQTSLKILHIISDLYDQVGNILDVLFIFFILMSFTTLLTEILLSHLTVLNFRYILVLINRFSPQDLFRNSIFLNFFFVYRISSNSKLSLLYSSLMSSNYPIALLDGSFSIQYVSTSFTRIFGYDFSSLINKNINTVILSIDFLMKIASLFENKKNMISQNVICMKENCSQIECNVTIFYLKDHHSGQFACIFLDLSRIEN
jgi:PAS domain S-box-containing protein